MTGPAGPPDRHGAIGLIWAQARGGVIGADGSLPWHLPEDLRLFRERTTGSTVVMGRRTWDSLPPRSRPLPGRVNVVLTRDPGWSAEGARRAGSVADVLAHLPADVPADVRDRCWVIGGGAVYAAFLPHASRLVVTDVDLQVPGDTRAPAIGPEWQRVTRTPEAGWAVSRSAGLRFAVSEYVRAAVVPAG